MGNKKNLIEEKLDLFKVLETNGMSLDLLKVLTETKTGKEKLREIVNNLKLNLFTTRIHWFNFYNEFFPESTTNELVLTVKINQTRIISSCQPNLLIVEGNITTEMVMLENNLNLPLRIKEIEVGEDYNLYEKPERKGTYTAWTPGQNCLKKEKSINLQNFFEDPISKQVILDGSIRFCSLKELLLRNMFATFIYGKPIDSGKVITITRLCQHHQPEKLMGVDFKNKSYFLINLEFNNINKKEAENIFFCPLG